MMKHNKKNQVSLVHYFPWDAGFRLWCDVGL